MGFFQKTVVAVLLGNVASDKLFGGQILNIFDPSDNIINTRHNYKSQKRAKRLRKKYGSKNRGQFGAPRPPLGTPPEEIVYQYAPQYLTGEYLLPIFNTEEDIRQFVKAAVKVRNLERTFSDPTITSIIDEHGVTHTHDSFYVEASLNSARAELDDFFAPAPRQKSRSRRRDASSDAVEELHKKLEEFLAQPAPTRKPRSSRLPSADAQQSRAEALRQRIERERRNT